MQAFFTKLFFFCLISTRAIAAALPEPVSEALKQAHIPLSSVGIVVQEIGGSKPLISLHAEQAMNPASTMKLLTTFAALETLGPAYRWKTEAYLNGKLENGVLQGDLVFKGYGDPKLTVEQFWMWLRELRQRGLREIRGDLVLDHSFFEAANQDPAEFDNDPTRAYNVGTNALLLNFNAMHLHLIPNGHETIALLEPGLAGYTLINRITTSAMLPCEGDDAYKARLEGHNIVLEGSIPAACGEADDYFSLLPHDEYFLAVFNGLWQELGGALQGKVREGIVPVDQIPFSQYISPPLSEVIRDINKFSNNTMARQLFLTLGVGTSVMGSVNFPQGAGEYPLTNSNDKRDYSSSTQESSGAVLSARQEGGDIAEPGSPDIPVSGMKDGRPVPDKLILVHPEGNRLPASGELATGIPAIDMSPAPARNTPKVGNLPSSKLDAELTPPEVAQPLTPVNGAPPDTRTSGGLGAGGDSPAANIARSTAAMQQWLKTEQLYFPELVLENGAGLSRKERISAGHLAELLQRATRSPFYAELEASLPILGMDGTVKKRFKDNDIAGYAHLKTGSLEGVKSIAGYVQAHSGKQWVVVFLVNHPNATLAQPAQDALIEWLQKEL